VNEIKPGIYPDATFEEYISWPCFHKSMVASALRSTAHLDHYIKEEKKSTKVMDFGSLVDALILEPGILDVQFIETPSEGENAKGEVVPWSNRLKFCQKWNQEQEAHGITPYSDVEMIEAKIIDSNIREHSTASEWLRGGRSQVAIVWQDKDTGILCKARIDYEKPDRLTDLKTTSNASKNEFKRTCNNFLYHVQASMYTDGWAILNGGNLLPFGFVVAESEAPYCVATYELGPDSLITGENIFKIAIRRYKDYLETGPVGYSKVCEKIEIPQWAINELDESLLEDTV